MPSISMDTALKLQLRLSQAQIQRLEMLSYTVEDMENLIRKEAETNPLLKVKSSDTYSMDRRGEVYVYEDRNNEDGDKAYWADRLIEQPESLIDHIEKQVEMMELSEEEKDSVLRIASSLDDKGFLTVDPATLFEKGEDRDIDKALQILGDLDPSGLGAKDVRSSLKLQVSHRKLQEEDKETLYYLIDNMEMIRGGKTEKAAEKLKTDEDVIRTYIDIIRSLSPYPGLKYSTGYEKYTRPEIVIKKDEFGEVVASYDDMMLPDLELDEEYLKLEDEIRNGSDKKAKKFFKDNKESAEKLIDVMELRKNTLLLLSTYLMDKQRNFFLSGPLYLIPDTQQHCAETLGISASTISRLCSGKSVDTDYGVFPLSYFFSSSSGFDKNDEGAISKNAIKEHIRRIIEENNTGKALSDQKISDKLNEMGIKVARRTVAKYRGELALDTSYNRN